MAIEDMIDDAATRKALEDFANSAPQELSDWPSATGVHMVPVTWCRPDRDARETYDEEDDKAFNEGILARKVEGKGLEGTGIDTPILLRVDPQNPERYLITAGRRRWRAAQAAGSLYVPASIQDLDSEEAMDAALRENVTRRGLSEIEEGNAFLTMQGRGDSVTTIATKMGKSVGYVNNRLRVARKPDDIKQMVSQRPGTMAHADAIDTVKSDTERARLIQMVVEEKAPLEKIKEEVTELDKRGLVKSKTYGSPPPTNNATTTRSINAGTIGRATTPAKVFVDWRGLDKAGRDATWDIHRHCRDHKPTTKEHRDLMLDALAAMEKDIKEAREYLGSEID